MYILKEKGVLPFIIVHLNLFYLYDNSLTFQFNTLLLFIYCVQLCFFELKLEFNYVFF